MPHTVKPSVYLIAKTSTIPENIESWLSDLGVEKLGIDSILNPNKTEAERLVESAGRRCYLSFQPHLNPNVTKIRKDISAYLNNILEKKDGSVLEHYYFTFAIEGVSRVFTGEFNRHRAGMAISEGSMRYIRYEDIPYWIPKIWQEDKTLFSKEIMIYNRDNESSQDDVTLNWYYMTDEYKEAASRMEMEIAFADMEHHYNNLCEIWEEELNDPRSEAFDFKKQLTSAMRRIIGMGVATGGVWSGNIRALRHICEMRITPWAEEEICLVTASILRVLMDNEPILFGDFNFDELGFAKPKYSKV